MQLDEGVRIQPMAAWAVPPIDNDDLGVGMLNQGVDEPHPECACTDHEEVGLHVHPRLSQQKIYPHPGNYGMGSGQSVLAIESAKQRIRRRTVWIEGPSQDHENGRAARAGQPRPVSGFTRILEKVSAAGTPVPAVSPNTTTSLLRQYPLDQ